jgi:hypothetical protein
MWNSKAEPLANIKKPSPHMEDGKVKAQFATLYRPPREPY